MSKPLNKLADCLRRYCELNVVNDELATLETAEAVLRARAGVVECLLQEGWIPPAAVVAEHEHDQILLAERPGALRG